MSSSVAAVGSRSAGKSAKQVTGLVTTCFAAIVILLIELGIGMWVNLYGKLPSGDSGASMAAGFGRAIADGPVGLSIHAVLGILLILSALTAVGRAVVLRRPSLLIVTVVGLAAVVLAAVSGATFVGRQASDSSMAMAVMTAIAIFAYALTLFLAAISSSKRIIPTPQ